MKAVCKKLFSLMLVAILLVSAVPFQASAEEVTETVAATEATVAATEATVAATEETVAATVAAVAEASEDEADAEIDASTPAANAEVVEKETVYVEFEIHTDSGDWRIGEDYHKTKIGSSVSFPSEGSVLKVWKTVTGLSDGYGLIRWEIDGVTFNGTISVDLANNATDSYTKGEKEYPLLHVVAEVGKVAKQIDLDPAKGTVATKKHKVKLDEVYNFYNELPTPTRSGYTFAGWYKADGTKVIKDETVVTDMGKLTARWIANRPEVTFLAHDGADWNEVEGFVFTVENNSVLKTEYSNFPTEAQIKALFKLDGWKISGWEYTNNGGDSWATFTAGKTKITGNTVIRPLYVKDIILDACDTGMTTRKLSVTLGKRIPTLPHPGTREGYAFVGWYLEPTAETLISSKADLSNTAKHPVFGGDVVGADVDRIYAGWANATTVYLYIHTNGNTEDHTKLVKYYDVPTNGFDLTTIKLADIFPNYGKYDDSGDEKYGWFTEAQWKNYCLGRHVYDSTDYVDADFLEEDEVHEFYIMLIDNGNNATSGSANGYNDNKTTVDKTNPSTGDEIFVVVTIMAVTACAAVLLFLNKKRIFK